MPKVTKRGRPPLPKSKVRARTLQIRLTSAERRSLERVAAVQGLSLADWARETLKSAAVG